MIKFTINFIQKINRKIYRILKKRFRLQRLRKKGLKYIAPNFIYFPYRLSKNSVIIDGGCGYEADFSIHMIDHYGLKSYAVDPTIKHRKALNLLQNKYTNHFFHVPFGISAKNSTSIFHENKIKESGSLLDDHTNTKKIKTINYKINTITLGSLLNHIGIKRVEILKLDLEGSEYNLFNKIDKKELLPFNQIFVEFHHHAIDRYSKSDTLRIVKRINNFGFSVFSVDDHNYLFCQK